MGAAVTHEVWNEGYAATGERAPALYLGRYPGVTFKEEVEAAMDDLEWDRSYYNPEQLTYWACRFFDNEADARRSFG